MTKKDLGYEEQKKSIYLSNKDLGYKEQKVFIWAKEDLSYKGQKKSIYLLEARIQAETYIVLWGAQKNADLYRWNS